MSQREISILNTYLPLAGVAVCKELFKSWKEERTKEYAVWDWWTQHTCYVSNTSLSLKSIRLAPNWWAELEGCLSRPEHDSIVFKRHCTLKAKCAMFLLLRRKSTGCFLKQANAWRSASQPAIRISWEPRRTMRSSINQSVIPTYKA